MFHIYADDVLLYIVCGLEYILTIAASLQAALICEENWMQSNELLLNPELLLFINARAWLSDPLPSIISHNKLISFRTDGLLRWLVGVHFDTTLSFKPTVNIVCRDCFF